MSKLSENRAKIAQILADIEQLPEDRYYQGKEEGRAEGYEQGLTDGETIGYENALSKRTELIVDANGTYEPQGDSTGFKSVKVSIPERVPILQEKTATENGDVIPDYGYDGLSKVTVNVEQTGGGSAVMKELTVVENGVYKPRTGHNIEVGTVVYFKETLTIDDIPSDVMPDGWAEVGFADSITGFGVEIVEVGFVVFVRDISGKAFEYYPSIEAAQYFGRQVPHSGWYLYKEEDDVLTFCDAPCTCPTETSIDDYRRFQSMFDTKVYNGFDTVLVDTLGKYVAKANNAILFSSSSNTELVVRCDGKLDTMIELFVSDPTLYKKIYVLDGLTNFDTQMHESFSNLEKVVLPKSVVGIGHRAFYYVASLKTLEIAATTPPTLGSQAFAGNYSIFPVESVKISSIVVPKGCAEAYKSATNWSAFADKIVEGDV